MALGIPWPLVPMLAKLAPAPPQDGDRWAFEVKWDGIRILTRVQGGTAQLMTRNLIDASARYPELSALGGAFPGRFPARMRVAAVVQAGLLGLVAAIVLASANVVFQMLDPELRWLIWLPVAVSAAAVVLNLITPSAGERRIWVPVSLVLLASSLLVALTA